MNTPIRSVLIANRGEIARRVIRTCRARGIETVAVFSDADAGAAYVAEADRAIRLPGNTAAETYLRVDAIIDAARAGQADAIHPGYGFLSENAAFAAAVLGAGLRWIGPPPAAIEAMGSKIAAKALMRSAGVPVAADNTVEGLAEIGLPALVKASAGGGGRGMRVVRQANELDEAIASAGREAAAAFGDGTVFVERYIEHGRHVEVQIVADDHGNTVALFERDCTIQRRHQKVVEEAPSPAVDESLRSRLCAAAVSAAEAVGYVGAGTVEFLLEPDGRFWFLEMNTRLQVEHPVTEAITGLDLVGIQLDIADGRALGDDVTQATITGHAIEVRLCAEDPFHDYRPSIGTFTEVHFDPAVRADSGIESGSQVTPFYDSMVAKLIAHGRTRSEAARILLGALRRTVLVGPTTNRPLLCQLLERIAAEGDEPDPEVDTSWLDRVDLGSAPAPTAIELAAAAQAVARGRAESSLAAPGWRSNPVLAHRQMFGDHSVEYRFDRAGSLSVLIVDGDHLDLDQRLRDEVDRVPLTVTPTDVILRRGDLRLPITPRFVAPDEAGRAGSTVAPMPGVVLRVLVSPGDQVSAGQTLLTIEAMKMEHQIVAPRPGTVAEVLVVAGQQLDHGQALVVVE